MFKQYVTNTKLTNRPKKLHIKYSTSGRYALRTSREYGYSAYLPLL